LQLKSQKDFFSGLMFMVLGVVFAVGAASYPIGQASQMGPGYFPLCLGVLLALLGVLITFKSLVLECVGGGKIGPWAWRPLFFIIGANLVFGVLLGGLPAIGLPPMGLIAAIYALTFIASMAQSGWTFKASFILASVLALGSWLTFVRLLKLPLTVWPVFIGG
jgi:hypothetical protein